MAEVELKVTVSELNGVRGYAFAFRGAPVEIHNGEGMILWEEGTVEWLHWDMVGEPGGTMHVKVLRGDVVISERLSSQIPNSRAAGFDEILVPQSAEA